LRKSISAVASGTTTTKRKNEEMVVINKAGPYTCSPDLLDRKIEFVTAE
jgi:hypothetical protein